MDFEEQMRQVANFSNELDVRARHSKTRDVEELSSYLRKLFLAYNETLRTIDARLNALEQK